MAFRSTSLDGFRPSNNTFKTPRQLEEFPTPKVVEELRSSKLEDFSLDNEKPVMRAHGSGVLSPFEGEFGTGIGRSGGSVAVVGKSQGIPPKLNRASTLGNDACGMKDLLSSFAPTTLPFTGPASTKQPQPKPTFLRALSTPLSTALLPPPQLPSLGDKITLGPVPRHYEPFSSFSTTSPVPTILKTVVGALEAIERCYFTYDPTRHSIRGIVYLQHTSATFVFHVYEHSQDVALDPTTTVKRFLCELKKCSGCSIGFRQFYQSITRACQSLFLDNNTKLEQMETQTSQQPFSFEPLPLPPPLSDDEEDGSGTGLDQGLYDALRSWISSPYIDTQTEGIRTLTSFASDTSLQSELVERVNILPWLASSSSPLLSRDSDVQNSSIELLSHLVRNATLQGEIAEQLTEVLCTMVENPCLSLNNIDTCISAVRCLQTLTQSPNARLHIQKKQYTRCCTALDSLSHFLPVTPTSSLHLSSLHSSRSQLDVAPLILSR